MLQQKNLISKWTRRWAEQTRFPFQFFDKVASTNDQAKSYLRTNTMLLIAKHQTKGRGQRGRAWINSDMMLSWIYHFLQAPQPITTSLMGNALCESLQKVWPAVLFRVKNPNDIYIEQKKIAGILVEAVNIGQWHRLIIGAGMNVFICPHYDYCSYLQAHAKSDVTESQWHLFLNNWQKQIESQLPFCINH